MPPIPTVPCGLCRQPTQPISARLDHELREYVCPECRPFTLWAGAHLKHHGFTQVTHDHKGRGQQPIGAAA